MLEGSNKIKNYWLNNREFRNDLAKTSLFLINQKYSDLNLLITFQTSDFLLMLELEELSLEYSLLSVSLDTF